jgi:hypothetical protein
MADPREPRELRPIVFVDINIGETPAGRIKMELYSDICPKQVQTTLRRFTNLSQNPNQELQKISDNYAPENIGLFAYNRAFLWNSHLTLRKN